MKIILLEKNEECGVTCPECASDCFQFLPDIKHECKDGYRLRTIKWRCLDCDTLFVQVIKDVIINSF